MTSDTLLQPPDAAARLREDGWQVLDVRTDEERAQQRIPEDTAHIPLADLATRAGEVDRERPVLVYCHSGVRSAAAVEAMRAAGWDAYDLAGGILAWAEAGLPVEQPGA
jgi:rhodanese-related sulfurtransferase